MDPNQLPPQQPSQPQTPPQPTQQFQSVPQQLQQNQQYVQQPSQQQPYQQPYPGNQQYVSQQQYDQQQPYAQQYPQPNQQQTAYTPPQPEQTSYEAYQSALASEEAALRPPMWPLILAGFGLLAGVTVLGFVFFGGGNDNNASEGIEVVDIENQDQTEESVSDAENATQEESTTRRIAIDKSVSLEAASLSFDLTFVEAVRGAQSSNSFRDPDEGFENVLVKVKVKNNGELVRSFFASSIKLETADGSLFRNDSGYSEFNQEKDWAEYGPAYDANDRIEAGQTGEGYILFVVPKNAKSITGVINWNVNIIGGDDVNETFKVKLY